MIVVPAFRRATASRLSWPAPLARACGARLPSHGGVMGLPNKKRPVRGASVCNGCLAGISNPSLAKLFELRRDEGASIDNAPSSRPLRGMDGNGQ